MAKGVSAPVNAALLRWAREEAGFTIGEAAQRLNVKPERVAAWEAGDTKPSINQARNAATAYRRTLAWLLTPGEPPEVAATDRPPDFRGVQSPRISQQLTREIGRARDRRRAYADLQPEPPGRLPDFADVLEAPEIIAEQFRRAVDAGKAIGRTANASEALRAWIQLLEMHGVVIFQMSRVEPEECQGVSLYYETYPVIILNGADAAEVRLFSLLHEVAHLLAHSSGVCQVWRGAAVERRCNIFAGAVLMPRAHFLDNLEPEPLEHLQLIVNRYRVSQSAVVIRLRDLNQITAEQAGRQLAIAQRLANERREREKEKQAASKSGPPHYRTQLRNLGASYVSVVLDAMHSRVITPVDASYFLESKLSTIDQMEQELLSRGASA